MKISSAQVKAARELLKITQTELADATGIAERTIKRFEAEEGPVKSDNLEKILAELERRGIEFTNGDSPPSTGRGIGVRLNLDKATAYARAFVQARKEADH